jgi:HTH-type transcriptional regulator/antitoxin HigA
MQKGCEMEIKPIRSDADYQTALARVDALLECAPGSSDANRLEVLSVLVEAWEDEHYPIDDPDPIAAIQFYMEQNGLRRRDLEPYIGDRARVADVLNRRRPLSLSMIRRLHAGLGIPSDLLIKPYRLTTSGPGRARGR